MRIAKIAVSALLICSIATAAAYAGSKPKSDTLVRKGCEQNIRLKIKSGKLAKADHDSEVEKCIENSSTYQ